MIAGQITPAADHLLRLRHRAAHQLDPRSDAFRVRQQTFQAHRDASRARLVAIEARRLIEIVHHQIQVAVVVKISLRHAERNALMIESPLLAGWLKHSVPSIAKRRILRSPVRMKLHLAFQLRFSEAPPSLLDLIAAVLIHHIELKPVRDQQIFVTI